ncbi:MAG: MltA domain-containing protein [Campylobacterota bacterium]|nr:MltA domain-containing protein [Campylobacterota bacterium]
MKFILNIFIFIGVSFFLFTGCSSKIEQKPQISQANMKKVDWEDLEGFEADDLNRSLKVFVKDCVNSISDDTLTLVCQSAKIAEDGKSFFKSNFTPYQLIDDEGDEDGLITGYYEPTLNGSYYQTKRYKYPIYEVPNDLLTIDMTTAYAELKKYKLRGKFKNNKIIPYDTRETIENKDFRTDVNLKPICFVDDKIDLFFLHIQGSGRVLLENGKIINVGYGAQNGRKYYSIGRKLIEIGAIKKEDVSLQTIREWLIKNPKEADEVMNLNESYIFFNKNSKLATGSLGTQLTPLRNLAVDRDMIPLGFPVFLNTTNPITEEPINQLMIAADTGGAIKGKIRADLFFGGDDKAEALAGKMKEKGMLYILVPNENEIVE